MPFKIPMRVIQIDERQRAGHRVIGVTLVETNDDPRFTVDQITVSIKVRFDGDDDPENGYDRKRFKLDDIWFLNMDETT